jgi:asparagine synthase (glutamine-hydrolysing)
MCGLCGGRFAGDDAESEKIVRRMAEIQRHRGPDDDGFKAEGSLHLGFRRLSIIDLDTGHQPIANEDGTVWVILNGEIYNFRELRKDLEARHTFRSHGDTEVIAHLYEEHGTDCFRFLNGMFGIAILDTRRRRLVLARDRAGVKPLHYAMCGRDFVFASEIKAILEHPECPRSVDPIALARYLGVQYVPGPRTMFKDISSLEPGHFLVLEEGGEPVVSTYWSLPTADPARFFTDRAACAAEIRTLVEDAVRMRLVSDVPLGALLSGGLDSAIVVGLMAKMATGPVRTIAVGFEGGGTLDERSLAQESARHFGTEHTEIVFGREEALAILPHLIWHNEVPVAEPLLVPSFFLFKEARRHVTVVLSGEGADELFGGYMRYRLLSELDHLRPVLPPSWWPGWSALRRSSGILSTLGKIGHAAAEPDPAQSLFEWNSVWSEPEVEHLLVDATHAEECSARAYRVTTVSQWQGWSRGEIANRLMALEVENRLVDFILGRADRMSMANSLELRTPFLDYRLLELSRRIPSRWKVNFGGEKRILRDAFASLLPEPVRSRPKHAFQAPYRSWLAPMSSVLLPESRLVRAGWLRPDAVRGLVANEGRSERDMKRLWSVLVLEMWHRLFIDREEVPALNGAGTRSAL